MKLHVGTDPRGWCTIQRERPPTSRPDVGQRGFSGGDGEGPGAGGASVPDRERAFGPDKPQFWIRGVRGFPNRAWPDSVSATKINGWDPLNEHLCHRTVLLSRRLCKGL